MSFRRTFLLATASLALAGCFERTRPSVDAAPRPVQAVRVALATEREARQFAGVIRPRHEADIGFRTGGRMVARQVDVGTRVTTGQNLARLDPGDLRLSLMGAEADLRAALARDRQAAADAARSRTLRAQGWVAAATDDEKVAAARDAAERVESDRATVALLQNKLDYAVLRAPVAGVITAVLADPGTVVSEGQAVVRLAEADGLEVEVALPEGVAGDALAMQRSGAAAEVTFWARPETRLAAHLRELSPSADTKLRTFTARYVIEAPPDWVALGMTATLHLGGMVGDPVVSLPAAAITDRGDGPMVWVVDPRTGALAGRPVRVSGLRLDRTLVTGLRPGELVVAMGVQKLDPAARVRVADIRPASE